MRSVDRNRAAGVPTSAPPATESALVASRAPPADVAAALDRFESARPRAIRDDSFARLDAAHPAWAAVLASATNVERAGVALETLRERGVVDEGNARDAAVLVWAAGTTRDAAFTEGLVAPIQGLRALQALAALPPRRRADVVAVLDGAASVAERAVLLKALAARATRLDDRAVVEIGAVGRAIRGASLEELVRRTTGYGLARSIEHGRAHLAAVGEGGVTQAFRQACGPSVRLLAEAEIDPAVALALSDDLRFPTGAPSTAETFQRALLQAEGGTVHRRDFFGTLRAQFSDERGTNLGGYLQGAYDGLGVSFSEVPWANVPAARRASSLDELERRLQLGLDVPLRLVAKNGDGHYAMLVDAAAIAGKRAWRVHDPRSGKTRWIGDDELTRGKVGDRGERLACLYIPDV